MKILPRKKIFFALFALIFLFLPLFTQRAYSQQCALLPVGQIPKRLLAAQDELIFLTNFIESKYSKTLPYAVEFAKLLRECRPEKCQVGDCPAKCKIGKCSPGGACQDPADGSDICPKEDLKKISEKIHKIIEEEMIGGMMTQTITKLGVVYQELIDLKEKLDQMEMGGGSAGLLIETDKFILLSCNEAKSLGLVQSCSKQEIEAHGIPMPCLGEKPDSNLDYYIWLRK